MFRALWVVIFSTILAFLWISQNNPSGKKRHSVNVKKDVIKECFGLVEITGNRNVILSEKMKINYTSGGVDYNSNIEFIDFVINGNHKYFIVVIDNRLFELNIKLIDKNDKKIYGDIYRYAKKVLLIKKTARENKIYEKSKNRVKKISIAYTHAVRRKLKKGAEYTFFFKKKQVYKCVIIGRVVVPCTLMLNSKINYGKRMSLYSERDFVLYRGYEGFFYKKKEDAIKSFTFHYKSLEKTKK